MVPEVEPTLLLGLLIALLAVAWLVVGLGRPCLLRRSWRLAWERLLPPLAPGGTVFPQGTWYGLGQSGAYPSHGRLFDRSEAFRPGMFGPDEHGVGRVQAQSARPGPGLRLVGTAADTVAGPEPAASCPQVSDVDPNARSR